MPLASRIKKIKIKKISMVPGYGKVFIAAANILSNRARNPVKLGSLQMGVVGTSRHRPGNRTLKRIQMESEFGGQEKNRK
jgi:hypothetical protein